MSGRTQRRARDQRDAKSNRGKQAARDRFKMPWKGENGRWTEFARTQFALVLAAALTPNERLHIASGGDYPSDRKRMEAAYDQCVDLYLEHGMPGDRDTTQGMQHLQDAEPLAAAHDDADLDIEGQGYHDADEYMRADSDSDEDGAAMSVTSSGGASDDSDASWKQRVQWDNVAQEQQATLTDSSDDDSDVRAPSVDSSADTPPAKAAPQAASAQLDERRRLRRNIKRVAKIYCQRLLWQQSLADETPNPAGYKLERYREELTIMRDMLVKGWVDEAGKRRLFRTLEELQAYDARRRSPGGVPKDPLTQEEADQPSFEELRKRMQGNSRRPRSCRTLWLQLKTLFKMKKIRQLLKRQRNSKMVQVCNTVTHACLAPLPFTLSLQLQLPVPHLAYSKASCILGRQVCGCCVHSMSRP